MSCGQNLPGRLGRADPALARALWPVGLAGARDSDIYAWLWDNEESARQSVHLNAVNHGHGPAAYGPHLTEAGWVTAVDIRAALARAEARAAP